MSENNYVVKSNTGYETRNLNYLTALGKAKSIVNAWAECGNDKCIATVFYNGNGAEVAKAFMQNGSVTVEEKPFY